MKFTQDIATKLSSFMQDNESNDSSMRLIVLIFMSAIVIVWTWVSVKEGKLADIPDGVLYLVATLMMSKVFQKGVEVAGEVKKPVEAKVDETKQ